MLAYAKIFMASAATSLSLAAVVIVGALGETIRTTAGMSAGSTNSMTIVSSSRGQFCTSFADSRLRSRAGRRLASGGIVSSAAGWAASA